MDSISTKTIVLTPEAYYDPVEGLMRRGRQIAVRDGTILMVDEPAGIERALGAKNLAHVDLAGTYLTPGLVNTHVHLEFSCGDNPLADYLAESPEIRLIRALKNAETMLRSGVTTVRDAGSSWTSLCLGGKEVGALAPLPRLIMCGPPLTETAGHLHFQDGEADSEEEIVKGVRLRRKRGARSIKIMATGGQMTPGSFPELATYDVPKISAAVRESRRYGMSTVAHCLTALGLSNAIRAGVDSVEHCAFFRRNSISLLERVFEEDVAKEGAAVHQYFMKGLAAGYHCSDALRETGKQLTELEGFRMEQERRMFDIFAKLVAMGFRPVTGTDAGVNQTYFDETWLEMILMEKAGLGRAEAIRAATVDAAGALRMETQIGRIAPGFSADFAGMRKNPLEDLMAFSKISWVMCRGKVVAL
jgi:imidazolonepropionase-like amidohydrolase